MSSTSIQSPVPAPVQLTASSHVAFVSKDGCGMLSEQWRKKGASESRFRSHASQLSMATQSSGCTWSLSSFVMAMGFGFVGLRTSAARVTIGSEGPLWKPVPQVKFGVLPWRCMAFAPMSILPMTARS